MTGPGGYVLPSIDVSSSFDRPAVAHSVPVLLENRDSGIAVLEGGFGLPTRLCRFVRPSGMIAVRLADPLPEVMHVMLRLNCDASAEEWWRTRRDRRAESAALRGITWKGPEATVTGLHRFLRVGAQGRPQALLLLDEPGGAGLNRTTQQATLEVRREDLDESGLLMVSVTAAEPPADWGNGQVLSEPVVGVQGARLRVVPAEGPSPITTSTGRQGKEGWQPWSPTIGYAALNRGADAVRLQVTQRRKRARLVPTGAARGWPESVEFLVDGTVHARDLPKPGRDGVAEVDVPGTGPSLVRFPGWSGSAPVWIRLRRPRG